MFGIYNAKKLILLIVFAVQISYIFWRLFQKWKELSDK